MLPKEIQRLFEYLSINYELVKHSASRSVIDSALELDIDPTQVALCNLVKDSKGTLMLVYPANAQIDLAALNEHLKRGFQIVSRDAVQMEWPTYFDGQCLPLALIYKMPAQVHASFTDKNCVYIPVNDLEFCRIDGASFSKLQGQAVYGDFFARLPDAQASASPANLADASSANVFDPGRKKNIQRQLESLDSLPAMPAVAQRLLLLNNNPYAGARDLAAIIEQDPSLAAQLIRYANSPLYGCSNTVESIQDAISRVLGYDLVMEMALGVSVGKMFKNPKQGRLGLHQFWRHATYCAALCQKLTAVVEAKIRPKPGMAYLTGLLHNIGILLLGHLFSKDFLLLNRAATKYPENSIIELEYTMIGVTHMELGVWLTQAWNMPEEIVISIREHHNEHYHDVYSVYPNLILLANRLLSDVEIGDEVSSELPQGLLDALSIEQSKVTEVFNEVMNVCQGLENMARQMAA